MDDDRPDWLLASSYWLLVTVAGFGYIRVGLRSKRSRSWRLTKQTINILTGQKVQNEIKEGKNQYQLLANDKKLFFQEINRARKFRYNLQLKEEEICHIF